jgi:hypothetical protein
VLAPHPDWDPLTVLVVQVDVRSPGLAVDHHRSLREALSTQLLPGVRDVAQDPVRAAVTQHLAGAVPGDGLSAGVPIRDPPRPRFPCSPGLERRRGAADDLVERSAGFLTEPEVAQSDGGR